MGQQAVIAKIDAERAEDIIPTPNSTTPVQLNNQGKSAKAASK